MNIGLIDVDGHNFPNLALMKISAYHKRGGDTVEWWDGFKHYDIVYKSRVFDDTYSNDENTIINADKVICGSTGYGLDNKLSDEIEHIYPDYSLYPKFSEAYGFLTRGCPRNCPFCIVSEKEGRVSRKVADLSEFWRQQKTIVLLDPNLLACKDHKDLLRQLAGSKAWVDFTQGLDARLLTEDNINALNQCKVKMIHFAWDFIEQSEPVLRGLEQYAKYGSVTDERKRRVYVLTNYSTTHEEDLYRIYKLREMKYDPFVMIYNKPSAPEQTRMLARWVNNKRIFRICERFEDYDRKIG